MQEHGDFTNLNIENILPNRFQPRIHFDENKLNELAESIRKYGVIQPIVVRQIGDKYEIIAGERRYKASKIANKSTIPAIVINLNDKESEEIALLENIQRQNLTPIEEAVSYKRILDMGYITQAELAGKLGKTQSTIANKVRLLNLDDQVQYALLNGKISERHARSLLRVHDKNKQIEILNKIIEERLTVKKTDDLIKDLLENKNEIVGETKENKVMKPSIVSSEPVENLFADEQVIQKPKRAVPRGSHEIIRVSLPKDLEEKLMKRGEKGMDIDKIMREAQDINTPEQNKDISNLMQQDANTAIPFVEPVTPTMPVEPQSEIQTNDGIPLVNEEQNKFINLNGIAQPEESAIPKQPESVPTENVSFDSIFNQTPIDLQPSKPATVNVANEIPVSPGQQAPEVLTPVVENPMMEQATSQPQAIFSEPSLEQTQASDNSTVSIATAVQQAMNSKAPEEKVEEGSMADTHEEASVSPVMENSISGNDNLTSQNNSVEPFSAEPSIKNDNNSLLYNELMQHDVTSTNESVMPTSALEPAHMEYSNNSENTNTFNELPATPVAAPFGNPTSQSVSMETSQPTITNIPNSDIIEASDSRNMASNIENNTEALSNNNFIEVIRLIRNCSAQIEKLGYFIDVDEIDLGNSYQATFRINKDK